MFLIDMFLIKETCNQLIMLNTFKCYSNVFLNALKCCSIELTLTKCQLKFIDSTTQNDVVLIRGSGWVLELTV